MWETEWVWVSWFVGSEGVRVPGFGDERWAHGERVEWVWVTKVG